MYLLIGMFFLFFPNVTKKLQSTKNLPRVNFQYIVGLKRTAINASHSTLIGYFNNQPFHTPPVALNFMSNAILRNIVGKSDLTINVANHPLPFTPTDELNDIGSAQSDGFQIGFNIAFG